MTNGPPLVSIALCTWNGARYLTDQLESLLAQEHPNLELVACDDASTDGTWRILERYASLFASARLTRNPRQLGANRNFEQTLALCRGDWIAPCDQDDIWSPRKIARLVEAAEDALLVYCDSELVGNDGRSLGARVSTRQPMLEGHHPSAFAFGNCVSGHASIFRRSLLAMAVPIPPGVFYDEWLAFVASNVGSIRYVDAPLVKFRQHDSNLTRFTGPQGVRRSPAEVHAAQAARLPALSGFKGPDQPLLQTLSALWHARATQWLTPRLAAFMFRHHADLMRLDPKGHRRSALQAAIKMIWGIRTKMLFWNLNRRNHRRTDRVTS